MRFIIDADLPRGVKTLLDDFGHDGIDVRDIEMGSAKDPEIAKLAQARQACLLTGDFGFANVTVYPPSEFRGIVVFELPRDATASFILRLVESFLQQSEVLRVLPGRLAIVDSSRIRLRPRPD